MAKLNKRISGDMPHSLEAEQALLGCLLIDTKIQVEVASFLREDDFFAESHKYIFSAMLKIIQLNQSVDLVTLLDCLEKQGETDKAGGIEYITSLTDIMPSSAGYKKYLDLVKRDSMLRKLILGSSEIIEECRTSSDSFSALANAEKKIYEISNTADTSSIVKVSNVIPEVMAELDELSKNKDAFRGIRTGFTQLDYMLNGFNKSDLIILAARPGEGKTSLAMNIVEHIAVKEKKNCAVFSLEMSAKQLVQRVLCSMAKVSMEHALKGKMTKTEWYRIAKAKEELASAPIYISDSAMITPQEVLSQCRRLQRKYGLDMVMIDYMQLMSANKNGHTENRQQEISDISRTLKILAKELNVPVLVLSQLSRAVESRKGRPQLSDLRESGAIEQDADIVMFIHRPDKNATPNEIAEGKVKKNVAELIVSKHRNGPQGTVNLYFHGEYTKFGPLGDDGEPVVLDKPDDVSTNNTEVNAELTAIGESLKNNDNPFEDSGVKTVDDDIFG